MNIWKQQWHFSALSSVVSLQMKLPIAHHSTAADKPQKVHSGKNIMQNQAKVTRLILDKSEGWKQAAAFCKLGTMFYKPWFLWKTE